MIAVYTRMQDGSMARWHVETDDHGEAIREVEIEVIGRVSKVPVLARFDRQAPLMIEQPEPEAA